MRLGCLSQWLEECGFTTAEKLENAGITVEERRFSAASENSPIAAALLR
jgi:hypothetical protein